MNQLLKRAISAFVYVLLFLFAILFSDKTYIGLITIFAIICLWEFKRIIKFKNNISYIILPIAVFYFKEYANENITLAFLTLTLLCLFRLLYHLFSENKSYPKSTISKIDLCIRYIILPFTFLILLPFINETYHPEIIIYTISLIWINDSFAFFVGKSIGKTKLLERVSPKKTIEGFVGGLIFAVIAGAIIGKYSGFFSIIHWTLIAIIIALFGSLGDLVESKFKRQANVKDSGNIMPGHGGLLDRLDSLFFVAPFVYLYIHYCI